jgi:excinuclease ABC subunit A
MRVIRLRGARTHNLQGIDLDIEPGTLLVVTGPSGAGKSSLAFGTLYAEGQRRYVESFSAYARQFLERLARPDVDSLEPVPAAIAVDRRASIKTSRSTVGTLTELTDYAKQVWAHLAELTCTTCGAAVRSHSPETAYQGIMRGLPGERVVITYPVAVRDTEHFLGVRDSLLRDGYRRLWHAGQVRDLDGLRPSELLGVEARRLEVKPSKGKRKSAVAAQAPAPLELHVVTDRSQASVADRSRLIEALEAAFLRGAGRAAVFTPSGAQRKFSQGLACDGCGAQYRRPSPGLFSYNSPIGACATCRGFGRVIDVDWDKVIPDHTKSIAQGAIKPWTGKSTEWERRLLAKYCLRAGIAPNLPYQQLSAAQRRGLIEGDGGNWQKGFPGLRQWFKWLESRAYKMHVRVMLSRYRKYVECQACHGTRFKPDVLAYRVNALTLPEFYALSVRDARLFLEKLAPDAQQGQLRQVLSECQSRLATLDAVGLHYLTLDRSARSLSGGELQRVSLTSALSAALTGTLFVLDEPTVGLHPADVSALVPVVRGLAQADNVVIVVESDAAFVRAADRVLELGPGAGEQGGRVVFDGVPNSLVHADTATGRALRPLPAGQAVRRSPQGWLRLYGACGNNLKHVELAVPLGVLTCVTGVSGSGKSSLILDTLVPAVAQQLGEPAQPLAFERLTGVEALRSLVFVDQTALGRTSRGNPATYLGVWDALRKRYAKQALAVERGYTPGTFSFNVAGGRCEACKGEGSETVEMQFLSDVTFSCPECAGRRFAGPVLDVALAGHSVADALQLSAAEARRAFGAFPEVCKALDPLLAVGAGYLKLGQPLNTLSGGEAQRLKLAAALASATSQALIVLDEPTAGLHAEDTRPLLEALQALIARGNTVLVVEHDMRVVASADHVIDLGPGAGDLGGQIVASGTPEQVASAEGATARALKRFVLGHEPTDATASLLPTPALSQLPLDSIAVRGAREHNLREVDIDIPREKLVVVTGPSGSGKSTLAFDVIFAESQRRYLETLSPYVRQYLKQLPRPAVDRVIGAPPSVSLEQRSSGGARNSTVATVTEVAHYLRIVYARAGLLHCPTCALPIAPRAPAALLEQAQAHFARGAVNVLAPVVRGRKGAHRDLLARARRDGFTQARIDGRLREIEPRMSLDRFKEHDIELLVGSGRAAGAEFYAWLLRALSLADGCVRLLGDGQELLLSSRRACPKCGSGFPEADPRFFSFNTRQGACETCEGHGYLEVAGKRGAEPERTVCAACGGKRLAGLALHTLLLGVPISDHFALSVREASERLRAIVLTGRDHAVAALPLAEALLRLEFLERVGLSYLALDRPAWSLSGGELQRVRLAAQLGSGLTGLLYVLDEPTIGLHPRDTERLISALRDLTGKGCSVLLVEHDAEMIRAADHVIDVGPGGGHQGGRILAQGLPAALERDPRSLTFASLARPLALPQRRRGIDPKRGVQLRGAREHNLKRLDLWLPEARFSAVTGVSGSGKSTLIREIFLPAVRKALGLATKTPGAHDELRGARVWKRAVEIDQTPIGRTPRSVPATYIGVWDEIRKLYAATPEARARGYDATRFSFNTNHGRCEACDGQGATSFEMSFLPEALVTCEACDGLRFGPETLAVLLYGKSAGELLDMDVAEVAQLMAAVPKVRRPLELLCKLGLGYLKLGQPSNTLSGGEAQRLKVVSELATSGQGSTLYVMDEPTTGLHREDVRRLLSVLQELVERGDTVVVIEHHPDVIAAADWVVDLGPEGGSGGGSIVAEGTPEAIMRANHSHTGRWLKHERDNSRVTRHAPVASAESSSP